MKLFPGARIGISALSGYVDNKDWFEEGLDNLRNLGLEPVIPKGLFRTKRYLGGGDLHRSSMLNALYADDDIDAIFFARGGTGVTRILDLLDWDTIRANPRVVMGYSDITALHLAFWHKFRMVSFSGPMVCRGWDTAGTSAIESFTEILSGGLGCEWKFKKSEFRVYSGGVAEGRLIGGNLTVLCGMLGTRYMPPIKDAILFIEEIMEEPESVDRLLSQLKLSGILDNVNAILLGDFSTCNSKGDKTGTDLRFALNSYFGNMNIPVVGGLPFGHIDDMIIIPFGVKARIDTGRRTLTLLERAVKLR